MAEAGPIRRSTTEGTRASAVLSRLLARSGLSEGELARYFGTSLVSLVRWHRGDTEPSAQMLSRMTNALACVEAGAALDVRAAASKETFASRGVRQGADELPLFRKEHRVEVAHQPGPRLLDRLKSGNFWGPHGTLANLLSCHAVAAPTSPEPVAEGISAGKNTYTYDAHTYHTKVPPQGIADVIKGYLPRGGLVLDPFGGSGMTGVAARAIGADVVLNELSPAASFIADRFTTACDPAAFAAAVQEVSSSLRRLRSDLYATRCRACGKETESLYTVWSYRVLCTCCGHEFVLWDHCRKYGRTVREHKILGEFPCPRCKRTIKKSRLKRTSAVPVLLGYKCCSRQITECEPDEADHERLRRIEADPPIAPDFLPQADLPDGVNLNQPKRHGLTSVQRFYTPRNLAAMSQLWRVAHCLEDPQLAGFVGFVLTSLYQRVTRLSEYRFWGGSGNTANFNVPYIFNEANVFVTFERKARSIRDHLETTARSYGGRCVVHTGSATDLSFLPANSVDFIFTDPPFGGNINYSEMNILWEAWLGSFTDATHEAIVNRTQNKDLTRYQDLMTASLRECHRVLRPDHWMVLVFMNSSQDVWKALRAAILDAGFGLERLDIFDKQHGTFKQFVSENTAGCDLLLHCRKTGIGGGRPAGGVSMRRDRADLAATVRQAVATFLEGREGPIPTVPYLHVERGTEVDYRLLYSEFLSRGLAQDGPLVDFAAFRTAAAAFLRARTGA